MHPHPLRCPPSPYHQYASVGRLADGAPRHLVGESGSGKSVTNLAIMGLFPMPPARVSAKYVGFDGVDLVSNRGARARALRGNRMAMIFQDPMTSLNPFMKVSRQLTEVLETHRGMNGKQALHGAIEMLERVGIPDAANRIQGYPHQFSGGMRQRVMIAMSLLCEPDLLIADEPTTALDIQAQVINLLADLQERLKLTYLFIAHDLAAVRHLSTRVAVMYLGRIVEIADADTIHKAPRHPYTKALVSAVPIPDPEIEATRQRILLEGDVPSPLRPPRGCRFHTRCPLAEQMCREREPQLEIAGGDPTHLVACHISSKDLAP